MTLLSLLFALLIERVTAKNQHWRASYYVDLYVEKLIQKQWLNAQADLLNLVVVIGLPCLFLLWFANWLGNGLVLLVFNAVILYICLGCPKLRATYKCYLQAADRGDLEACDLYSSQLGHDTTEPAECNSFGQHLIWLNYTHYAAVIIGFVLFGAAGAVLYVLSYGVIERIRTEHQESDNRALVNANHFMWFLDFIPVRITALGFLLVGHFGRALPVWGHYLFDLSVSAKTLLCRVSSAAEDVELTDISEPTTSDSIDPMNVHLSEPKILVKLAKRNIVFLMVAVSLLTMVGGVA